MSSCTPEFVVHYLGMHLKTALTVLVLFFGMIALGFGVMAALGVSINLDLSSPGPIKGPDRPALEQVEQSNQLESAASFRFSN